MSLFMMRSLYLCKNAQLLKQHLHSVYVVTLLLRSSQRSEPTNVSSMLALIFSSVLGAEPVDAI